MRERNIYNKPLKRCSLKPLTGYHRDGYCRKIKGDRGKHTVCAKVNEPFLKYSREVGNDLSSVVEPNDKWCLCEDRYLEAFNAGVNVRVDKQATNSRVNPNVKVILMNTRNKYRKTQKGGKPQRVLPKLRKADSKNKKHHYRLTDPQTKRILAINEGIRNNRSGIKRGATAKKGRLNILRIYRRNNNYKECKRITDDMRYIDKKYKLGKTKNICSKKPQKGGKSTRRNRKRFPPGFKLANKKQDTQSFLFNPDNPSRSFDVYIDKNPEDTIPIKYTTVDDVKDTIKKLERLYKAGKYSHKRIWQVGMIMKVRLEAIYNGRNTRYKKAKNVAQRYKLAKRYFEFLSKRSGPPGEQDRKKMVFKI